MMDHQAEAVVGTLLAVVETLLVVVERLLVVNRYWCGTATGGGGGGRTENNGLRWHSCEAASSSQGVSLV